MSMGPTKFWSTPAHLVLLTGGSRGSGVLNSAPLSETVLEASAGAMENQDIYAVGT